MVCAAAVVASRPLPMRIGNRAMATASVNAKATEVGCFDTMVVEPPLDGRLSIVTNLRGTVDPFQRRAEKFVGALFDVVGKSEVTER